MELADMITCSPAVSLEEMLEARERRAERQRELLRAHAATLVSFTMNIPGEYKAYPLVVEAFREGLAVLDANLGRAGFRVIEKRECVDKTGVEGYRVVAGDAARVKRLAVMVEEIHPLGRFFDIDVLDSDGAALRGADNGRGERRCLVCGKPVWECARSRAHSAEELALRTAGALRQHLDASYSETVAAAATRALLYEVNATPKPGLVDRNNNGSHCDMDIFTFIDSSVVLTRFFQDMARRGMAYRGDPGTMLPSLRVPGQWAEEGMFAATGGVNTHKGLIFSLGLLCAALGWLRGRGDMPRLDSLLDVCAAIAANMPEELAETAAPTTHGERVHSRYGLVGARGEAARGYPHVREYGYPVLRRMVEDGCSLNDAGVVALLHLLAHVEDTNIVSRSDLATLRAVQEEVRDVLAREREPAALLRYAGELDRRFIAANISPGGSADLLALSYFLYFVLG